MIRVIQDRLTLAFLTYKAYVYNYSFLLVISMDLVNNIKI